MADHRLQIILAAKDISGTAFGKFKGTIAGITKSVFSLQGAIGTLAGSAGVGYLVKSSLDAADAIGKTADKLGLSTSVLQEYQYAANQSGVSTETLNMALQRFTRRTAEAAQGKGELKDVLKQYNIAVKDAAGNTRRTQDVLADLADVIQNTESSSERLRIAFKAFDSEGAALVNMLKNGSTGLDDFRDKAQRLGLVIDDNLIAKSSEAKDQLDTLSKVIGVQVTSAAVALAPEITKISQGMINWLGANKELIQQDIAKFFNGVAAALGSIADAYRAVDKFLSVSTPESYLEANKVQLEATLNTQQKQLEMLKRLGSEGSVAYEKLLQRIELTQDKLKLVRSELAEMDKPKFITGGQFGGGPIMPGGRSGGEPIMTGSGEGDVTGTEPSAIITDYSASALEGNRFRQAEIIQRDALQRMKENAVSAYQDIDQTAKNAFDNMVSMSGQSAFAMEQSFSNIFYDAMKMDLKSFKSYFASFLDSIMQSWAQAMAQMATQSLIGSLMGAGSGGGGFFSFLGGLLDGAAGGSSTIRGGYGGGYGFAQGGVVSGPTVFPFAGGIGLMGEAGPEAILPLSRTRTGDLGVKAAGGGQGVVIENYTVVNLQTLDTQTTYEALKRSGAVEGIVTENLNGNGSLRHAILENL